MQVDLVKIMRYSTEVGDSETFVLKTKNILHTHEYLERCLRVPVNEEDASPPIVYWQLSPRQYFPIIDYFSFITAIELMGTNTLYLLRGKYYNETDQILLDKNKVIPLDIKLLEELFVDEPIDLMKYTSDNRDKLECIHNIQLGYPQEKISLHPPIDEFISRKPVGPPPKNQKKK